MWRVALRGLAAHRLRLALSGLAVVLGVSFVAGTMVFTDTLSRTFNALFESTAADVTVSAESAFTATQGGPGTSRPEPVPTAVLARVQAADGVEAAEGFVQAEGVYVLGKDGKVLDTGGAPGIGVSWYADQDLSPSTLTQGRAPQRAGEVALDTGAVEETGYRVGDRVALLTPGPRVEAELVGVFRFGESGGLAGASLAAFDLETAQELLGVDGFTGISVQAADGSSDADVARAVTAAVGDRFEVKTREQEADDQAAELEQGLSFISVFLLVFAGVALFVGSFIILNTFSMLVAQRTKELALLRALGASRRQVTRSVLLEALVLGVVGSTLGLAGGLGVAAGLRALFASFGLTLDGSLVFAADTVAWGYAVGVLVTLVAAYLPARRAARTAPVAAMRDDHAGQESSLRRRTVAGAVLAVVGAGALVAGDLSDDGSDAASLVGLGALVLVLAAIALSPVLARGFLTLVGGLLPRLWGTTGHLARQNVVRNPRRTAATASALMVGLALVSAFSVVGASTNASIDALVGRALGAEFVVSTAVQQPFTPQVAERLRDVEGVRTVLQQRFGAVELDGERAFVTAVQPDALDGTLRLDLVQGGLDGVDEGGLLVDEATAERRGWEVGTRVPARGPGGQEQDLTVRGVYTANQAVGTSTVGLATLQELGGSPLDRFLYVDVSGDAADVRPALDAVLADYPVVALKDQTEFAEEQKGQVGQLLLLINALLVLSLLIAVLGIVNTLALSVVERTREIGLLRAVGLSRRQLRRMVRLESVVIAVYGALLGLVLGTVFGVSLVRALSGQGISEQVVPYGRLLAFLVVAGLVGVLAAVWPARRAARLGVLTAIATT